MICESFTMSIDKVDFKKWRDNSKLPNLDLFEEGKVSTITVKLKSGELLSGDYHVDRKTFYTSNFLGNSREFEWEAVEQWRYDFTRKEIEELDNDLCKILGVLLLLIGFLTGLYYLTKHLLS